ncbi:MAG: hypothetical protein AAGA97_00550 [Pseudomonadota bacterium]
MKNTSFILSVLSTVVFSISGSVFADETISIPILCIHGDLNIEEVEPAEREPISGILASDHSSENVLRSIMDFVGLRRGIQLINYENYRNACAEIGHDQKRRIYVDEDWINTISGNDYWIKFFLLSHELGHHLNAHSLAYAESESWEKETDADWFAGRVYSLASGNEATLQAFFDDCPFVESKTHPPCFIRRATVEQAYTGLYDVAPPPRGVTVSQKEIVNEPSPSVSSLIGRTLDADALAKILNVAADVEVDEVSEGTLYDVVVQAGHLGRIPGVIGAQGAHVSEQELAAFVSSEIVMGLRERGLESALIGANRTFDGKPRARVFLSIHADAASDGSLCKLGPSISYDSDQRPDAANVLASAISISLDYKITDFLRDNLPQLQRSSDVFNWFDATIFAGHIEIGELTCEEQEVRLINGSQELARNLTTALEFVVASAKETDASDSEATIVTSPANELLREVLQVCSVSRNIEIDADLRGSIETIFSGELTEGRLSFVDAATFLESIPLEQRLEAYKIYLECISERMAESQ